MFEFDYTVSGIARFNAIRDSAEARAVTTGMLIGDEGSADRWYIEQLMRICNSNTVEQDETGTRYVADVCCSQPGEHILYLFDSNGMETDGSHGVCEDKDVRCIRFRRMVRNGRKPYGDEGRVFKKKAGEFLAEIIRDSGLEYTDDQRNYLCTRFAVEWMEARIKQFGADALRERVNEGAVSSEAIDMYDAGAAMFEQDIDMDDSQNVELMAEVLVLSGGNMTVGVSTCETVHVDADTITIDSLRRFLTKAIEHGILANGDVIKIENNNVKFILI